MIFSIRRLGAFVLTFLMLFLSVALEANAAGAKTLKSGKEKTNTISLKPVAPKDPVQAKEIWSLGFEGERPAAAFFDAATGAIFVSVDEGNGRARLDKISLDGKVEKRGMATFQGSAGPLRAHDGKLYWVAGSSVQIVDPKGARSSLPGVPGLSHISAIAIDRNGSVFLLDNEIDVHRIASLDAVTYIQGAHLKGDHKLRGIFQYLDRLYVSLENRLLSFTPPQEGREMMARDEGPFCDCRYLERTSSGAWLTTHKNEVLVGNKTLLTLKTEEIGHPGYVFRMDTAEDFFVLPLPKDGMLRAYRMPVMEKARKTEK